MRKRLRQYCYRLLQQTRQLELDELSSWPLFFQLLVLLVSAILLLIVAFWWLIIPKHQQVETAKIVMSELALLHSTTLKQLDKLTADNDQLQQQQYRYQRLLQQLPTQTELANLLASVNQLGIQHSLVFTRIDWGEVQEHDFLYRLPLNMELHGRYHDIGQFTQSMAMLPRLISFSNAKWQRVAPDRSDIKFQVKAYTYRLQSQINQPLSGMSLISNVPLTTLPVAAQPRTSTLLTENEHLVDKSSADKLIVTPYQQDNRMPFMLPSYKVPLLSNYDGTPCSITSIEDNRAKESSNKESSNIVMALPQPLNELHFKGVISRNQQFSAIIQTSTNKLFRIEIGDSIGPHQGIVSDIDEHHLVINEVVNDEMGCKNERKVTLELNSASVISSANVIHSTSVTEHFITGNKP